MFLAAACATARRFNPIRSVSAFTATPGFGSTLKRDAFSTSIIESNNSYDKTRKILFRMSSSNTETSEEHKTDIEDQIKAKGDEIRAMKESGADKKTVAPFVEELLALKAKLEPPADKKEKKKPTVTNKEKKFIAPTSSTADLLPMINTDSDGKILKRVKTVDASPTDEDISIKGWVRTVRKQKTLAFVEVNDGSSLSGIQCVLPFDDLDEDSKSGRFFVAVSIFTRYFCYLPCSC